MVRYRLAIDLEPCVEVVLGPIWDVLEVLFRVDVRDLRQPSR